MTNRPILAVVAAVALTLGACGSADEAGTPTATGLTSSSAASPSQDASPATGPAEASPSAEGPDDAASESADDTSDDTEDSASGLSIDTVPATIGDYTAFANEITGINYSTSGDASTPMIYVMSMGSTDNFDDLLTALGVEATPIDDSSFCDASASDPSCYFVAGDEAFYVGADPDIPQADVETVIRELQAALA